MNCILCMSDNRCCKHICRSCLCLLLSCCFVLWCDVCMWLPGQNVSRRWPCWKRPLRKRGGAMRPKSRTWDRNTVKLWRSSVSSWSRPKGYTNMHSHIFVELFWEDTSYRNAFLTLKIYAHQGGLLEFENKYCFNFQYLDFFVWQSLKCLNVPI